MEIRFQINLRIDFFQFFYQKQNLRITITIFG